MSLVLDVNGRRNEVDAQVRGYGAHSIAAIWKQHLSKLLEEWQ